MQAGVGREHGVLQSVFGVFFVAQQREGGVKQAPAVGGEEFGHGVEIAAASALHHLPILAGSPSGPSHDVADGRGVFLVCGAFCRP